MARLISLAAVAASVLSAAFLAGHALGAIAFVRDRKGSHLTSPERLALQVLFLQAVGLGGTVRFLRRDLPAQWKKPERAS